MTYYIDGLDVKFGSVAEIEDFLMSLSYKLLYQFIDRHVYYGDADIDTYICVATIQISYTPGIDGYRYQVDIVRASDNSRYRSVCLCDRFMNRYFTSC